MSNVFNSVLSNALNKVAANNLVMRPEQSRRLV